MYTFAGSSVIYKTYNRQVKISNIGLRTESLPDISARRLVSPPKGPSSRANQFTEMTVPLNIIYINKSPPDRNQAVI
jgi:hypothetical protein